MLQCLYRGLRVLDLYIYIYESLWHGERESSWELQGLLTVQFPRGIEGN